MCCALVRWAPVAATGVCLCVQHAMPYCLGSCAHIAVTVTEVGQANPPDTPHCTLKWIKWSQCVGMQAGWMNWGRVMLTLGCTAGMPVSAVVCFSVFCCYLFECGVWCVVACFSPPMHGICQQWLTSKQTRTVFLSLCACACAAVMMWQQLRKKAAQQW